MTEETLSKVIKQIFCIHKYECVGIRFRDRVFICKKCGWEFIPFYDGHEPKFTDKE